MTNTTTNETDAKNVIDEVNEIIDNLKDSTEFWIPVSELAQGRYALLARGFQIAIQDLFGYSVSIEEAVKEEDGVKCVSYTITKRGFGVKRLPAILATEIK